MASFSIPLSGLDAYSQALSAVSNNLANLNTTSFKAETPQFSDLFYQQIGSAGSGDPVQVGVGSEIGSMESNFTQGSVESSGVPTDVAIQGNGFFIANNNGFVTYTRAGNFSVNDQGLLTTADGSLVQGYPAVNGAVNPNGTLGALNVGNGLTNPPNATTTLSLGMNLNASAANGSSFSTPVTIYDALGTAHVLTFTFTKNAANAWDYSITAPPADLGKPGTTPVVLASTSGGTGLTFSGSGALLTTSPIKITMPAGDSWADGATVPATLFSWDLDDANNNPIISQVASPSAASFTNQDGYSSGTLSTFAVQNDGTIEGTFSNGRSAALGQIALANFPNLQGLMRNGSNEYLASIASGAPSIGAPNTGGRGSVSGGALELSNADISTEFTQLIMDERGFQANSRAITTMDNITQEALNLIQP